MGRPEGEKIVKSGGARCDHMLVHWTYTVRTESKLEIAANVTALKAVTCCTCLVLLYVNVYYMLYVCVFYMGPLTCGWMGQMNCSGKKIHINIRSFMAEFVHETYFFVSRAYNAQFCELNYFRMDFK